MSRRSKTKDYLDLTRAHFFYVWPILFLSGLALAYRNYGFLTWELAAIAAAIGLFGFEAGLVLNDYVDRDLDKKDTDKDRLTKYWRPFGKRPLAEGGIKPRDAMNLFCVLVLVTALLIYMLPYPNSLYVFLIMLYSYSVEYFYQIKKRDQSFPWAQLLGRTDFALLMIDPGLMRDALDQSVVMHGKLRDADGVQPRSNRHALFPMRQAASIAEVCFFLQQPVGDDLIFARRGDDKFRRGFVVRMVNHRQPLPRIVRPVFAEKDAFAEFVFQHSQSVGGNATVTNGELLKRSGFGRRGERDGQSVGLMFEGKRCAARNHFGNGHAFAAGRRCQIERDFFDPGLRIAQLNRRFADDFVALIAKRQSKRIVQRINARLPRISIGNDKQGHDK